MRTKFAAIVIVSLALLVSLTSVARAELPDTQGREFWLTFPLNRNGAGELKLFIGGQVNTAGTVSIPGLSYAQNFNVTAGQFTVITLPAGAEITANDAVQDNGVHVTATQEVTVYGSTYVAGALSDDSADAYMGLPADVLGTDYLVLGYETDDNVDYPGSQFALVGTQDDTTVVITPTADTWNGSIGRLAGEPYQITLNQGQTYLLYADQFGGDDLTGTDIHADKPIAVFGGNRCANIPYGYEACATVVEQLPPTWAWGKEFAAVPLATRSNGDTFRILAAQDDTEVWVNGTAVPVSLGRGAFYETVLTTRSYITATKPVLVAQYSNGRTFDSTTSYPFMMLIPPYEQTQGEYVVNALNGMFAHNYLNVVTPSDATASVLLDGNPITATLFQAIGSSGFSGAQVPVAAGTHTLSGSRPVGVSIYGFSDGYSGGYPGGSRVAHIVGTFTVTKTVAGTGSISFAPLDAEIDIIDRGPGNCLSSITLQRFEEDHPQATTDNLKSGRYWTIKQSGCTPGDVFTVTLTLPLGAVASDADDKLCRWANSAWDCGERTVHTVGATHITRADVNAFSDWTVAYNTGPTAVGLRYLAEHGAGALPVLTLGGLLLLSATALVLVQRKRATR
jgi:hypothetical protein